MNIAKKLDHIATMLGAVRRYGKTTLTAKACKELGGVYLCASQDHAKRVLHEHGVHTESIDKNLSGIKGPFFIDHYAVERLLHRASSKINEQNAEIKTLQERVLTLEYDIEQLITKG